MTSFQTRRNIFARLCLEGRSNGSVRTNSDKTDEFVIVPDNLVPVAGLTMKRQGERTFVSELDRE